MRRSSPGVGMRCTKESRSSDGRSTRWPSAVVLADSNTPLERAGGRENARWRTGDKEGGGRGRDQEGRRWNEHCAAAMG